MSSTLGHRVLPGIDRSMAEVKFTEFFGSVSAAHTLEQVWRAEAVLRQEGGGGGAATAQRRPKPTFAVVRCLHARVSWGGRGGAASCTQAYPMGSCLQAGSSTPDSRMTARFHVRVPAQRAGTPCCCQVFLVPSLPPL